MNKEELKNIRETQSQVVEMAERIANGVQSRIVLFKTNGEDLTSRSILYVI